MFFLEYRNDLQNRNTKISIRLPLQIQNKTGFREISLNPGINQLSKEQYTLLLQQGIIKNYIESGVIVDKTPRPGSTQPDDDDE